MTDFSNRNRARLLRERLDDRDLAVLQSLYQLRLATSGQLQRLHVPDGTAPTRARRMRAILHRLSNWHLLVRLARTIGGRPGSTAHIYGLSGLGLAMLDVPGPYGRRRRTVWETKPFFTRHVLAVTELCVGLTEVAQGASTVDLLDFDGEPKCWRPYPGPHGAPARLKPDAYVRMGVGDFERHALVEVDMATESLPTVALKCQTYLSFWRSGVEQQRLGLFPQIVWLVPDEDRQKKLQQVIAGLPAAAQYLFIVAQQVDGPAVLTAPVEAIT